MTTSLKKTLHVQHTFFVHFFAVVWHDYNVKRPETSWLHVLWKKCRTCSCWLFFSLSLIFTLVAANISHFLTAATKFLVVPPTKNVSFVFSIPLKLFFSLSFAGLSPYFLFFAIFLFLYFPNLWTWQLMQAKYFRQHGYKNIFRFPFSSLVRCLCFTRRGWPYTFPSK